MKNRIDDFVLGAMTPEERAAMAEARRHDPALDRAVRNAEDHLAALSLAAGELMPPLGLWGRINAALETERAAMKGRTVAHLGEGDWEPLEPGIDSKTLWNDRTSLLRCAPGAVMPGHLHEGKEHLLVLSGDLIIGGRAFLSGDYVVSPEGYDHFFHTTRTGCLLLSHVGE